jgi:hypothetical protein
LGNPPPPLKIVGSRIVTAKGNDVMLKGINWFGFNVRNRNKDSVFVAAAEAVTEVAAATAIARTAGSSWQ